MRLREEEDTGNGLKESFGIKLTKTQVLWTLDGYLIYTYYIYRNIISNKAPSSNLNLTQLASTIFFESRN